MMTLVVWLIAAAVMFSIGFVVGALWRSLPWED